MAPAAITTGTSSIMQCTPNQHSRSLSAARRGRRSPAGAGQHALPRGIIYILAPAHWRTLPAIFWQMAISRYRETRSTIRAGRPVPSLTGISISTTRTAMATTLALARAPATPLHRGRLIPRMTITMRMRSPNALPLVLPWPGMNPRPNREKFTVR